TNGTIVQVIVNHPPTNLYDNALANDFHNFTMAIQNAPTPPKVVVVSSSLAGYWIYYLDIHVLSNAHPPPPPANASEVSEIFHEDVAAIMVMPTIWIAAINGRTFGAGNELALAMDMRFAGPKALLGTIEAALGITHANDGIQYLVALLGRARALEVLLSAGDADAKRAEAIGWVNTAYDSAAELKSAVGLLAHRISLFPEQALNATKTGV
ncbi:ClpP/crotonase, partial [Aulographum hederae CBS 113979]